MAELNRMGDPVSLQVSQMGVINIALANFMVDNGGTPFQIKNNNDDTVTLEVRLAGMQSFIQTPFAPGWNPEIVVEVKQQANVSNIQWGA